MIQIRLSQNKIISYLTIGALGLSFLHIASSLYVGLARVPLDSTAYSFLARLDQNQEIGLATWYSSVLLLIVAALAAIAARITNQSKKNLLAGS